jgi:hypothetical protein
MTTIHRSVALVSAPDEVWRVVGDFGRIDAWHPDVSVPELRGPKAPDGAGTQRVFGAGTDAEFIEQLVDRDDERRRLVYTIPTTPFPISEHEATIVVRDGTDGGSVVDWEASFTPDTPDVVPMLDQQLGDGVFQPGLDALAERFGRVAR